MQGQDNRVSPDINSWEFRKTKKFRNLKLRGEAAVLLEGLNKVSTVVSFLEALLSNNKAA